MTPGTGAEAAYAVVATKRAGAVPVYRVEKTFAAVPKTARRGEDGSVERVLKVFRDEASARQYKEKLDTLRGGNREGTSAEKSADDKGS